MSDINNFEIANKVKEACEGLDAVYEDYLINLIGVIGLQYLKANKLVESCGSVNGRNLYALCIN